MNAETKANVSMRLETVRKEIRTIDGPASYLFTETEDANGRWSQAYETRHGYYVIHQGTEHHVYLVDFAACRLERELDELARQSSEHQIRAPETILRLLAKTSNFDWFDQITDYIDANEAKITNRLAIRKIMAWLTASDMPNGARNLREVVELVMMDVRARRSNQ